MGLWIAPEDFATLTPLEHGAIFHLCTSLRPRLYCQQPHSIDLLCACSSAGFVCKHHEMRALPGYSVIF